MWNPGWWFKLLFSYMSSIFFASQRHSSENLGISWEIHHWLSLNYLQNEYVSGTIYSFWWIVWTYRRMVRICENPLSNPQSAQCHLVRTASFRGRWTCVICIERLSRELPAKPHLAEWVGTCKVGLCWPVFGLIMCCCRCLKSGKPPGTLWFRKSRNG